MYGGNYFGQPYYGEAYDAGITFDATANSGYHAADATYTWTHVVGTGYSQILVVSVGLLSVVNSVTALTYNGVALTKLRSDVSASTTVRTEIWYLIAPTVGSNTVSITLNTANVSGAVSTSYNYVDQTAPVDAQNGGTAVTGGGGGSSTISTTTVTNGAWLVDAIATADTSITPTNLQTATGNITGAVGSAAQSEKDTNAIGGTSVAMGWDNIAALTTWTMSTISLKPVTGNSYTNPLTGTLSFTGNFSKPVSKVLTGALSFTGSLIKFIRKVAFTSTLSFIGSMTKQAGKVVSGVLSFTGTLVRASRHVLTATLSFLGTLVKALSKTAMTAILTFTGALTKRLQRALTATLSFTGTMAKLPNKVLTATLSFVGNIRATGIVVYHNMTATLSFVGSISKGLFIGFTASLSFVGTFLSTLHELFRKVLDFILNRPSPISLTLTMPPALALTFAKLSTLEMTLTANETLHMTFKVPSTVAVSSTVLSPISITMTVPGPITFTVASS